MWPHRFGMLPKPVANFNGVATDPSADIRRKFDRDFVS